MITKEELKKAKEKIIEITQKLDNTCDPYLSNYLLPVKPSILELIKKAENKNLTVKEYKELKKQIEKIINITEKDAVEELNLEESINCLTTSGEEYIVLFPQDLEKISELSVKDFRKLKKEVEGITKEKEKQKTKAIMLFILSIILGMLSIFISIKIYNQQANIPVWIPSIIALFSLLITLVASALTVKAEKLGNVKPDKYPVLAKITEEVKE